MSSTIILLAALVCTSFAQQCDEAAIVEALAVDPICTNSYSIVSNTTADVLRDTYRQDDLDIEAIYLCGDHCGAYFYDAAYNYCEDEEATEDFLQLHCACTPSRCSPSMIFPNTSYCAYTELQTNLNGFLSVCGDQTNSCTPACATLLQEIVISTGCCLRERFDNSDYLRPGDSTFSVFGNEDLYTVCNVAFPEECEEAFEDSGAPRLAVVTAINVFVFVFTAVMLGSMI